MAKPLFKIIVPVYNAAAYLDTCIQSLQSQSYSRWDAICIDDGSTDETAKILDRYASEDKRIHVIHQENGGVGKARNAGLAMISPDKDTYVSFVDADDFVSPVMYSTIAEVIENVKKQGKTPDYIRLYCQPTTDRIQNWFVDGNIPDFQIVDGGGISKKGS